MQDFPLPLIFMFASLKRCEGNIKSSVYFKMGTYLYESILPYQWNWI